MKSSEIVVGSEYAVGGRGRWSEARRGVVLEALPRGRFVVRLDPRAERLGAETREVGAGLFLHPWSVEVERRRARAAVEAGAARDRERVDALCARLGLWLESRGVLDRPRRRSATSAEVSLLALLELERALALPPLPADFGPVCQHALCRQLWAAGELKGGACEMAPAPRREVSA